MYMIDDYISLWYTDNYHVTCMWTISKVHARILGIRHEYNKLSLRIN